jgi:DNA-binding NtrC family response regulator
MEHNEQLLVGNSPSLNRVREQIAVWAHNPRLPVLITGETGSGKEVVAESLHRATRPTGPWIAVNCADLHSERASVILFGSIRGVFTGVEDNIGAIRAAHGGTIFLDELGEMPLEAQASLLRVLNDRQVRPVGGTQAFPVDVQFVFATHRGLIQQMTAGRFRPDLYYRIAGLLIRVPALRDHADDIPAIAARLEPSVAARLGRSAWRRLQKADWPGNVRQLRTVLYRAGAEHPEGRIGASQLSLNGIAHDAPQANKSSRKTLEEVKADRILEEVAFQSGNVRAASRVLNCSPMTIYRYAKLASLA